jgi:hypothetical protein
LVRAADAEREDKMRKLVPRRPSPALVVACLALFVALGGTSLAVVNALPRNSVGAAQLRKNAVNSQKVKNKTLLAVDFKAGQLPKGKQGDKGNKGDPGPAGPKGDTGAKGDKGDKGATGPNPAATAIVREAPGPPSATSSVALVSCLSDERAVGGGAGWATTSGGAIPAVVTSMPTPGGNGTIATGWRGVIRNVTAAGTVTGKVSVICVKL